MNKKSIIECKQVSKSFALQSVLRKIDFNLQENEYLALVGVNGAGKSTLVKCLLDMIEPDSGDIRLFDKSYKESTSRSNLFYLPEKFSPPYYLKAKEFLNYMAELDGVEYKAEDLNTVLRAVDLEEDAIDKPVKKLSKGMSQKIGLAACLLSGKALWVLDEPMSGLDPRARASLKQYLLEQKDKYKQSLLFTTHLLNDVEALADRILILDQGKICFNGTVESCCETYNTKDFEQAYLRCVKGIDNINSA